jgi:hypothetical protein
MNIVVVVYGLRMDDRILCFLIDTGIGKDFVVNYMFVRNAEKGKKVSSSPGSCQCSLVISLTVTNSLFLHQGHGKRSRNHDLQAERFPTNKTSLIATTS